MVHDIHDLTDLAGRDLEESVGRRERLDNLELLDLLEDEDDPEMTDPKETLYETYIATYKHPIKNIAIQITFLKISSPFIYCHECG